MRPTTRKEWLEKILFLAETNKPARLFRTQLGIKLSNIPAEVAKLPAYRKELDDILEKEKLQDKKKLDKANEAIKSAHKLMVDQGKLTKPSFPSLKNPTMPFGSLGSSSTGSGK